MPTFCTQECRTMQNLRSGFRISCPEQAKSPTAVSDSAAEYLGATSQALETLSMTGFRVQGFGYAVDGNRSNNNGESMNKNNK